MQEIKHFLRSKKSFINYFIILSTYKCQNEDKSKRCAVYPHDSMPGEPPLIPAKSSEAYQISMSYMIFFY